MAERFRPFVAQAARLAVITVLIFAFVRAAQLGWSQPQNDVNLLDNPDFETNTGGLLADGWVAWPPGGDTAPEYHSSAVARSGDLSQWVGSRPAGNHDGGFYQQVSTSITIGNAVSFGIWHSWPDDPQDGSQSVETWIGIDPYGGTEPSSSDVLWSANDRYASVSYQKFFLGTTAMSSTVTVYTRSKSQYPTMTPAYVLWDDAALTSGPWQKTYLPLVARDYVPPCTLQNGVFEGDYVQYPNARVAEYWSLWWNDDYDAPEWNQTECPADCQRIRSGEKAQQYGNNWKHYEAGVYQQMTGCTVSGTLRFSAYGLGFAARDMGSPSSDPDGNLQMRVGIDPTGSIDPTSSAVVTSTAIVWSEAAVSLDAFRQFEITATVQSPTVTVFLYSKSLHPEPIMAWFHNTSYWDDATMEKLP